MALFDDDISLGLPTVSPAIPGRWVHSFEEDADGVEVYRPSGFELPPAPRDAIELLRNGTVIMDAVDRCGETSRVNGTWQQPTVDRLALSFADGAVESFMLQAVADVDVDLLRARRLPATSPTISPAIPGRWIHSFEDDHDGIEVYRAGEFDFPPSARTALELLRNGTLVLDEIDAAGGITQVPGRWRQPTDDRLAVSFDGGARDAFILQAVDDVDLGVLNACRLPEPSISSS